MVSGMDLLEEPEQIDYERLQLDRYATRRVHDRIIKEAENHDQDREDMDKDDWRECTFAVSLHIWRGDPDFRTRCHGDWEIKPSDEKGRRRARIAALKEAENGN